MVTGKPYQSGVSRPGSDLVRISRPLACDNVNAFSLVKLGHYPRPAQRKWPIASRITQSRDRSSERIGGMPHIPFVIAFDPSLPSAPIADPENRMPQVALDCEQAVSSQVDQASIRSTPRPNNNHRREQMRPESRR